ncbi:hypothetical protein [Phytobacter sp. V91]|uniref:hypothetical protein n=1 Tax=Phytobacter sp. V91 TaxID=3369425 RepID=UPI003F607832
MATLILRFQFLRAADKRSASRAQTAKQNRHHHEDFSMTDFARVAIGQQAVRLNWFTALIRKFCYLLAQKGNPETA